MLVNLLTFKHGEKMSPINSLSPQNAQMHSSSQIKSYEVPMDYTILKVLCCLPLLRIIPLAIVNTSLNKRIATDFANMKKLENAEDKAKLQALAKVKSDYLWTAVISKVLQIALCIAGLVSGLLAVGTGLGLGVLSLASLGLAIYQIRSNNQVMEKLKSPDDFPLPQVIY
jgi:hypothetical protein